MNTFKLSVVIPAYNEEKNVAKTVRELTAKLREKSIPYEVIVVNDASTDGTAQVIHECIAEDPCVRTVDRSPPGGFGRAIRSGLEQATGDVIVIYMADQSDDPDDVVLYYNKILEGYDCVFGSRFVRGATVKNYPPVKLVVNRIVNKLLQWLFFCQFNDLTNAFKAYRAEVIRDCGPFRACHFNITVEMSLSALARKYQAVQVPIRWYGRTWGSSNLRLSQMGRRYLSTFLKVYAERILISDDLIADRLAKRRAEGDRTAKLELRVDRLEKRLERLEGSDADLRADDDRSVFV